MEITDVVSLAREVSGQPLLCPAFNKEKDGNLFAHGHFGPGRKITEFYSVRFGQYQSPVPIPQFIDEKLYPEWLERMVKVVMLEEEVAYQTYKVETPLFCFGFDFYECADNILTYHENPHTIHQAMLDEDGKTVSLSSFRKLQYDGYVLKSTDDSPFLGDVAYPGDFYRHPGNIKSSFWDHLKQIPEDAYYGKDLYYAPSVDENHILIRIHADEWLWTNYKSFVARTPSKYFEELSLMKALGLQ